MKFIIYILISICVTGFIPVVSHAQLSSDNYQVDVQYVGEEGGGYATSTNYQFSGASGTPYEYDPSVAPAPDDGGSGSITGSRARQDEETGEGGIEGDGVAGTPGGPIGGGDSRGPVAAPSGSDGDYWGDVPSSGSQGDEIEGRGDSRIPESLVVVSSKMNIIWERIQERPYVYSFLLLLLLLLLALLVRTIVRSTRGAGTVPPSTGEGGGQGPGFPTSL